MSSQVQSSLAVQLNADRVSRKIAEGKTITLTEFQDWMTNEIRRFVVWEVKLRIRDPQSDPEKIAFDTGAPFDFWATRLKDFIINPPLGS